MEPMSRLERIQKKGLLLKEVGETMQRIGRAMMFKRDLKEQEGRLDEFFAKFKEMADRGVALKGE